MNGSDHQTSPSELVERVVAKYRVLRFDGLPVQQLPDDYHENRAVIVGLGGDAQRQAIVVRTGNPSRRHTNHAPLWARSPWKASLL